MLITPFVVFSVKKKKKKGVMFVRKKINMILLRFGCKRNVAHTCARIQGEYFSSEQRIKSFLQ